MKTREQMIADGWTYYPAGTKYANHTICCQVIVDGEGNLIAFKPHDEAPKPAEMAPQLAGYWRDPELPIETLTFDWGATITAAMRSDTGPIDVDCFELSPESKSCLFGYHEYMSTPTQSPQGETCTIDLTGVAVELFVSPPAVEVDENDPMVILRSYENYG